ncbi:acyltransferase [Kitasatospora albolonga]|uniref:acyltransferase family protein n=1 Tax=Kitasatospora albolonga TaxID=68173 RepID=UPI0031EF942F
MLTSPWAGSRSAPLAEPVVIAAPERRGGRLHVLDALRLIAAVSAMTWHYAGFQRFSPIWGDTTPAKAVPLLHPFAVYGWVGVELFFLISGFVICMSVWGRSVGQFVTSRVSRLFPAYWAGVLMTSAMLFLVKPVWDEGARDWEFTDILTNLTMMQNGIGGQDLDGVYWTLWLELRFYVLIGLLALWGLTYRRVVAFCGVWTLLSVFATNSPIPLIGVMTFPQYSPYFISGVAMYLMYRFGPNLLLWGLIGLNWLLAQNQLRGVVAIYSWDAKEHVSFGVAFALITLAFLAMIGVALGKFDWVRWKWLTVAGALTYPVYLLHQQLGWWVIRELHDRMNPYLLLAGLMATMLLVAWLLHRLVERPLGSLLKRKMEQGLRQVRTASQPPVRRG